MNHIDFNTTDLIIGLKSDGKITSIKGHNQDISHSNKREQTLQDIISPDHLNKAFEVLNQVVSQGRPSKVQIKNRQNVYWAGYLVPTHDNQEKDAINFYVTSMSKKLKNATFANEQSVFN